MPTLTIRDLDEQLKGRLRVRAAMRGRSMEEEARQILRAALDDSKRESSNLADTIRRRFVKLGDVHVPVAPREPIRDFEALADARAGSKKAAKNAATKTSRRR